MCTISRTICGANTVSVNEDSGTTKPWQWKPYRVKQDVPRKNGQMYVRGRPVPQQVPHLADVVTYIVQHPTVAELDYLFTVSQFTNYPRQFGDDQSKFQDMVPPISR